MSGLKLNVMVATLLLLWTVPIAHASWVAGFSTAGVSSGSGITGAQYSSSSIDVTWTTPAPLKLGVGPVKYRIQSIDAIAGVTKVLERPGSALTGRVIGLKSATSHTISLKACYDAGCTVFEDASDSGTSHSTAQETWQISEGGTTEPMTCYYDVSGVETSYSCDITKVNPYSNTKAAAYMDNTGNAYLYYDAMAYPVTGVTIGSAASTTLHTINNYDSSPTYYGLNNPSSLTGYVYSVSTSDPVPLSSGKVRLFFEAAGSSLTSGTPNRIHYLDSASGSNKDFDTVGDTICSDYSSTGDCPPTIAIGTEADSSTNYYGIKDARQLRVGYPDQAGNWDTASPAFMIFTVNLTDGTGGLSNCLSTYGTGTLKTQGYAQTTSASSSWSVQFDSGYANCPKIFQDMQAPSIMHRGQGEYKVYYGTPADTTYKNTSCSMPWLGAKKIMYAHAAATGSSSTVEYEDWEAKSNQRDMQFAWPNGEILSARAEGYIDDFEFIAKPGNLMSQHAYLSITDGSNSCDAPFITYAALVNP